MGEDRCFTDDWKFVNRAGVTAIDGKVFYPAMLRLVLSKDEALTLIPRLINFIREKDLAIADGWEFIFHGKIEKVPEE